MPKIADSKNRTEIFTFRAKGELINFLKSKSHKQSMSEYINNLLLNSTEYMEFVIQKRKAIDDKTPSLFPNSLND